MLLLLPWLIGINKRVHTRQALQIQLFQIQEPNNNAAANQPEYCYSPGIAKTVV
jgi:hypothetical protein